MWTRFNFFVVIEFGLSTALWAAFGQKGPFMADAAPRACVGLATTVCSYCFGAQDRYLVEAYRRQAEDAGRTVAEHLGIRHDVCVGDRSTDVRTRIYQWRVDVLSPTKLVAWFPMLVTTYWLWLLAAMRGSLR
jgi:hypothetical protein